MPTSQIHLIESQKPLHPHLHTLETIQLWSDVQIKAHGTTQSTTFAPIMLCFATPPLSAYLSLVEINDIIHSLPTSFYHPVVSVKRFLISPHRTQPPRPWTYLACIALKTDEFGTPTSFSTTSLFPTEDVVPGALVDGIVDRYDGGHIWCRGIVGFPCHGLVEL